MLSLRTLILVGAVVYLLPSDPARQQAFVSTANQAFQHVTTYCDRDPAMCDKARTIFDDLKSKAHFGIGVIYALATRSGRSSESGDAAPAYYGSTPTERDGAGHGTLTSRDLEPAWRGNRGSPQHIRFD